MRRAFLLGGVALAVFAVAAFAMLQFMPQPVEDSDYLVVGSVSTLASMLALFLMLASSTMKGKDVFFKRRRKRP